MQDAFGDLLSSQLESLAQFFTSPAGADITEEALTSVDFNKLKATITDRAPNLWMVLYDLGQSPRHQRKERRDPVKVCSMLSPYFSSQSLPDPTITDCLDGHRNALLFTLAPS